ncbi:MAG TPA: glutamate-1-semialdehyde 2,1-aminomutase [Tepidisphaeraceae bacterium]
MADPSPRSIANSESAFAKAKKVMPGGVSSPVRSFNAVGGTPLFVKEAHGCRITDIDGNSYIDYVGSYGPLIAGHANERVVAALSKAIGRGTSYGAPTEYETHLAEMIISAFPGMEMIRFVNSGTEATMSAIRLARAATSRDLIVKFIGGYHGHSDGLLAECGSGALTLGTPSSPGVPKAIAASTVLIAYNDLDAVKDAFEKFAGQIACILIEPIAGNMGVVLPAAGYLAGLRELCDANNSLLIFDEVMSGFRVAWGGAQNIYNVKPDLTCLGKVIGGGLPVGAYGGSARLMNMISPAGPVYQAGTLSGNPLAMSGGLASLEILQEPGAYETLEQRSETLAMGLQKAAADCQVPIAINRAGSMLTIFFTKSPAQIINSFDNVMSTDRERFKIFFHAMLDHGIYLPPSAFEAMFVSLAHDEPAIEQTIDAAHVSFAAAAKGGES